MMLPRKRQRPNPTDKSSPSVATPDPSQAASTSPAVSASGPKPALGHQQMPPPPSHEGSSAASINSDNDKKVHKTQSWYGSWPRQPKAPASTSVTQENIFGGTVKSKGNNRLSRFDPKNNDETASLRSVADTSSVASKAAENGAIKSDVDASTDNDSNLKHAGIAAQSGTSNDDSEVPAQGHSNKSDSVSDPPTEQTPATAELKSSSAWLGWWSKTPFTETQAGSMAPPPRPTAGSTKPVEEEQPDTTPEPVPPEPVATTEEATESQTSRPASWFGFWASTAEDKSKVNSQKDSKPEPEPKKESEDVVMEDAPSLPPPPKQEQNPGPPTKPEPAPKAGSTWAFWSKDAPKSTGKTVDLESGEIAVIGERSEAHPKPMAEGVVSGTTAKESKDDTKAKDTKARTKSSWRKSKKIRPPSMDADSEASSPATGTTTPEKDQSSKATTEQDIQPASPAPKTETLGKPGVEADTSAKPSTNLLLPSFSSTYQMKENPSILQQITQLLLRTSQPPANHVFRVKEPPKIRKAIAIGVHGLFPAMYLRPMIGQPTGTSLRFASLCADAIRRWADRNGCSNCEIEKVALEGDGRIKDRVENLWRLMLNWIEHIRDADLVIIACHSQGVPVSIMLLEKLIELGIITNAKIGVCAMAGVALGPFPEYKSSILMGSAAELWDFGNPESSNSQRFEAALKKVVEHGARITFVGSIDDQLVPMESAVYSPGSHPYIYRAVFIDGRTHAPDFIAHLVGFALKLRNLGVSDHGLIRELSIPLAGSLYSGEGHSRLYFDDAVYDLAVSHVLETSDVAKTGTGASAAQALQVQPREVLAAPNPYVLPWIMRGMLEEEFVKTELSSETEELLRQFDDWKPTNKALKDVKYRLEAVRSKL